MVSSGRPASDRAQKFGDAASPGRVDAARKLGWTHLAAVVVDEDSVEATAYAIADNRTAELAEWDESALADLLDSLPDGEHAGPGSP